VKPVRGMKERQITGIDDAIRCVESLILGDALDLEYQ
jgi:hypothetical protein